MIVVCDGNWPSPSLKDHPDLTMIIHAESIGQRAAINEAAKLSKAKYVMKLDAHCIVDEGFDVKLMADCKPNWTVIPAMYNLHAFNWRCKRCGNEWYQSPTPTYCQNPGEKRGRNEKCDSKEFERVIVWQPRKHRRSEFMRFDKELKFQYWGSYKRRPEAKGDIVETMSFVGACFFMPRAWYFEIGGCDEKFGSWGQQGTEMACKTWMSGGQVVVNKKTWFSHLFRTQGGDFGFPYPQSGRQVARARKLSREYFLKGKWKAKRPFQWIIDHFKSIPDWHDEKKLTKGIIYYTNGAVPFKLGIKCRRQIAKAKLPIVSTSLKPLDFGRNIVLNLKSGWEAYFKQILTALEASTADIVFFCEHDCLYSLSHFDFIPPKKDVFYYDDNWFRVRITDGHAVRYDTHLLPFLCGYRELLLEHYRKVVKKLETVNFSKEMAYSIGFEPGTHHRDERVDDFKAEGYRAKYPSFDIRHSNNLTKSKWSQSEFRSPRSCRGWEETRFRDIFREIK